MRRKLVLGMRCVLCMWMVSALGLVGGDWPQWRGPNRDDLSTETGLLKVWPEAGPKRVWLYREGGMGYSGPAIVAGQLYTMGTREVDGGVREVVLCLDAATGQERWVSPVAEVYGNNWGDGPRGTPTVDGERVYALGGQGTLVCLEAKSGKRIWSKTMQELGGAVPGWGYTESVLVDGDRVICTPGEGRGTLAALQKHTGEVLWRSKEWTDGAQYASPIVMTHAGVRQYVQLTMQHVAGVRAEDGALLWKAAWPGRTAVIPTPIARDGDVYVTAGYGVGCMRVRIGSGGSTEKAWENKVMKNHHGGVILVADHLYGYSDGPGWVCQDWKTGEEVWSNKSLGKGAIGYADGHFYCVDEGSGTVVLIEANPKAWVEKGRFKLEPQTQIRKPSGRIWTHPVVSQGRLYLRDQDLIYCYAVK